MQSIEMTAGWGMWMFAGVLILLFLILLVSAFFVFEVGPRHRVRAILPRIIGPLRTSCQACGVTYLDDADHVTQAFKHGKCPDCGSTEFYEGPSGGLCTNIQCAGCQHWFNHCGFFVERIMRTNSTPGQEHLPDPVLPSVQAPRLFGRRITLPTQRR